MVSDIYIMVQLFEKDNNHLYNKNIDMSEIKGRNTV